LTGWEAVWPLLAGLLAGCSPGGGRGAPPVLTLDPASALQGTVLVVNISAEGVRFDECGNLVEPAAAVESVEFLPPGGAGAAAGGVAVYVVQPISSFVLRVEIAVAMGAEPGDYRVEFRCDDAAPLAGSFRVRERKDDPALVISPSAAAAGTTNLLVEFQVIGGQFVPGSSHIAFGSGSHVTVEEQIYQSATEMAATIDIAAGAPLGPMEVTVTTEGQVARGSFTIEERIYPTIQVFPDVVYRPAAGEPAVQATLTVVGSGVDFVAATAEDTDEDPGTVVSFPGNPGIAVTSIVVTGADTLLVNILVDALAILGPTPLTVTTGEETAVTDFTVLVTPDTPVLTIHPSDIVRGAEAALFLAQAVNFSFDEPLAVAFAAPGCQVEGFQVLPSTGPPQAMAIDARASAGFQGAGNVLVITSGGNEVAVHMTVSEPGLVSLASPNPATFAQGSTGFAVLTFQGTGSFSPLARAEVLTRSGLRIPYQSPAVDGTSLTFQLQVAADAPLGPGLLRVTDAGTVYETFVKVTPSGLVPGVSLSPQLVLPGRRSVVLEADSAGLDFTAGPVEVAFDDPALRASSIQVDGSGHLSLIVDVAPSGRDDMAVVYFADGNGSRAAATLRELPSLGGLATAVPGEVQRGVAGDQLVQVAVQGGAFGQTVAQMLDGIGVEVKRVTVLSPTALELALVLEDGGPGGWIGVLLKTGARQVLVPLHIAGGDESLSLQFSPAELRPGASASPVVATAPAGYAGLDPIFTVAGVGSAGAFASVDEILGPQQARILLDVSHAFAPGPDGLPVLVTATKGAYAGFLAVAPLLTGTASGDLVWQGTLAAGETRLVSVDTGMPPAALLPSVGAPAHADVEAKLIDGQGMIAVAAAPPEPLLWVAGGGGTKVAVTPAGDPGGVASSLALRSFGELAVGLTEPDDTPSTALPVGDPCAAPVLLSGAIGQGLDVDRVELDQAPCELAAVVIARSLAPRPWDTPDCWLERRGTGNALLDRETGAPRADPRLFLAGAAAGEQLVVGGELGSAGAYLLNLRRAAVIGEICLAADGPFIELAAPPGAALDSLTVELVDGDSGLVVASLSLAGQVAGDSGAFVIGGATMTGADLTHAVAELPDSGVFALRLRQGAEILDALQVGGEGGYGEGDPLDRADGTCFFRPGTIDTDHNRSDFLPVWSGTPGTE
jgi:hypothetical protein